MKTSSLKQIEFDCLNGSLAQRRRKCRESLVILHQEMTRLRAEARHQCADYKETKEAWTSQRVEGLPRPLALPQDIRDGRLAFAGAFVLAALELVLAFFIAIGMGSNPLFFVLLALVMIFFLKAGLIIGWRNPAQPQQTRRRLTRSVIWPSIVLTLLAAVTLTLARTALGLLALALTGLLNLTLGLLSLGVLGLSAGFFAMGHLLFWSLFAEKKFRATEQEAAHTEMILRQVEQLECELATEVSPGQALAAAKTATGVLSEQRFDHGAPRDQERGVILSLAPLLLGMLLFGGCTPPPQTAASVPSPEAPPRLEIYLDWSLSAEMTPFSEAVNSLLAALPAIINELRAGRLTIYQFSRSGWAARELVRIELPTMAPPPGDEAAALFGQVKSAQQQQAVAAWRTQLEKSLRDLTAEKLLPPSGQPEPRCTDLQGVLRRVTTDSGPQRRVAILLTDGHDTCSRKLTPVAAGNPQTSLVVMLLPERATNAAGRLSAAEFDERRAELSQAVPGAVVRPYFDDLIGAVKQALGKPSKTQE